METLLGLVLGILQFAFAIVWWIAGYLFWVLAWLVLPFVVVAYVAMLAAEKIFGRDLVRAWIKERSKRLGSGIAARVWTSVSRVALASTVLPFRVLFWFGVYAVWHSIVSLLWTPKWRPWTRAWGKRWRPERPAPARAPRSATKAA